MIWTRKWGWFSLRFSLCPRFFHSSHLGSILAGFSCAFLSEWEGSRNDVCKSLCAGLAGGWTTTLGLLLFLFLFLFGRPAYPLVLPTIGFPFKLAQTTTRPRPTQPLGSPCFGKDLHSSWKIKHDLLLQGETRTETWCEAGAGAGLERLSVHKTYALCRYLGAKINPLIWWCVSETFLLMEIITGSTWLTWSHTTKGAPSARRQCKKCGLPEPPLCRVYFCVWSGTMPYTLYFLDILTMA
mgnify:CR=1 FL=1